MKNLAILAVSGLLVAGCAGQTPGERVATGALLGGAAGAGAGQAIGGDTESTVIGGILGAGAGSMAGAASAEGDRWCTDYDRYGEPYRYRC